MFKTIWQRIVAWFKGLPWVQLFIAEAAGVVTVVLLVKGKLVWTDFLVLWLFIFVVVVAVWKIASRPK